MKIAKVSSAAFYKLRSTPNIAKAAEPPLLSLPCIDVPCARFWWGFYVSAQILKKFLLIMQRFVLTIRYKMLK